MSSERGGVATVFVAVLAGALLAMAALVADGGRILLARREAGDRAGAAARAGAQELDLDQLRTDGTVRLDPPEARAAAAAYLAAVGAGGRATVDGDAVTVTVTADVPLPLLGLAGLPSRTVSATRSARAVPGITQGGGRP